MMKKLFLSTLFILFILLAVALYRTFTHTPSITGIIAGEEISIDEGKLNKDRYNIICTLKLSPTNMRVEKFNNIIV